jgi:hypothetical protein
MKFEWGLEILLTGNGVVASYVTKAIILKLIGFCKLSKLTKLSWVYALHKFTCVPTHHRPINVLTAGEEGLPYGLYTRRTGHNPPRGPRAGWWVLTTANAAGINGLTCLPKQWNIPRTLLYV